MKIRYCSSLKNYPVVTYILFALWVLFLFIMLGIIANNYFVPLLTDLSIMLKLSPEVAGLTLLALGNGASDIGSTIAAANSNVIGMALGEIIGSGLLVTTATIAFCIFFSKERIVVAKAAFVKDISFYIVGTTAVFFLMWNGTIHISIPIIMILGYIFYIVFSVVQMKCHKKESEGKSDIFETEDDELVAVSKQAIEEAKEKEKKAFSWDYYTQKLAKMSTFQKIWYWLTFIPSLPLTLTITTIRWNRAVAIAVPVFSFLPIFGAFQIVTITIRGGFPLITIFFMIGFLFSIIILATSTNEKRPKYFFLLVIWSFLVALCWIYIAANEIIAVLHSAGILFNISHMLLGATILTFGNCIADLVSGIALARKGHGRISISASYGGPIFNILFSLGVALLIQAAKKFPISVSVEMDKVFFISSGFLFFNLYTTLIIVGLVLKFKLHKAYGAWLLVFYISYLTVVILSATQVIWPSE